MKILVTGANGFIGRNLIAELFNRGYNDILSYDFNLNEGKLDSFCKDANFVFHLAGVNRPNNDEEFLKGNVGLTSQLVELLKKNKNSCPILFSSSIQAELDNPYGRSKRAAEEELLKYSEETSAPCYIFRLPNIFGKWSKPNYNSAVATFCYNISRGLDIVVRDPAIILQLGYIDDAVCEFLKLLTSNKTKGKHYNLTNIYTISLGDITGMLYSFKKSRENGYIPNVGDDFTKKLYSTYLSYLDEDDFCYNLLMHEDYRGSFTEFLRTYSAGQISVNVLKPHIKKGDHWHHTKIEKFLTVVGSGVIRFRKLGSDNIIEYYVSSEKLQVVDVPIGYTHNIENLGDTDMVTLIWCNEVFDPENPDTYVLEV